MRRLLLVLTVLSLAACGGDDGSGAATTTTTTSHRNPKYDLTYREWETAALTSAEEAYEQVTRSAFGIGTNPPKMLEYGYDLCERYEDHPTQAISDTAITWGRDNGIPTGAALSLGVAASKHLCP